MKKLGFGFLFFCLPVLGYSQQEGMYLLANGAPITQTNQICLGEKFAYYITAPYTNITNVYFYHDGGVIDDFTPVFKPQGTPNTWIWELKPSIQNAVVFNTRGRSTIKVGIKRTDGTVKEIFQDLYIADKPTAGFTVNKTTACLGDEITFTDQSTLGVGNEPITQYLWDFGDGNTLNSTEANPKHTYLTTGTFRVKLQVKNRFNCESNTIAEKDVIITNPAVVDFDLPAEVCAGEPVTFVNNSTNLGISPVYSWEFGLQGTSNDPNPTFTFSGAGLTTVTLKVNNGGCETTRTKLIKIKPKPFVDFEEEVKSCAGEVIPFKGVLLSGNIVTWAWDFGDGNTATGRNTDHTFTLPGHYPVKLTVTSTEGCETVLTKTVTINHPQPMAAFVVPNGTRYCSGDEVVVENRSTVPVGSITRAEWFRDYQNNSTVPDAWEEGPSAGSSTWRIFYRPVSVPTTFEIRVKAYSGASCVNLSDPILITVYPKPALTLNAAPAMCLNTGPFQLEATETTGLVGVMTFTGPGVSTSGMFDPQLAGLGDHIITCTFTANSGCEVSQSITVTVNEPPEVLVAEALLAKNIPGKINPIYTGDIQSYEWTPAEGVNDPASPNPEFTLKTDRTYQLKITGVNGCVTIKNIPIQVVKEVKIPDVFTPNGDGINDIWMIENAHLLVQTHILIVNRWGQTVFSSDKPSEGWDGTVDGKPLDTGVYYYVIKNDAAGEQYKGNITLIR